MFRAEILAEGVREELPQPLLNAAPAKAAALVHSLVNFHVLYLMGGELMSLTFGAIEGVLHAFADRCSWKR